MKIEKGIPIPRRGHGLPFEEMEIGDSFAIPQEISPQYARHIIQRVQKKMAPRRFSLRKFNGGYRCWRTA